MSMIGKTLGTFECTALIGKGGMGEVYQAKDQKLGRDVAVKVLPEEFAKDADRVARFQREAKLLASLNHPNIAAIHGLEEADGTHFLVLELIEGDTLADRLKRGAIPVEESLKLALQIAEALEAAHEKGVIHRDLKPANIKVTPDGKVKVLDFGLAKVFAGEQAEVNLSHSPTLSEAATLQGVILGTAAYMPPEQAKGKSVDKRADIWAFGVVLFEMLSGRKLFTGETVSETLASVIKSEPDWKSLPPNLHPRIQMLLDRCLEKEFKNRCSGVSDIRVEIQKVLADPSGIFVKPATAAELQTRSRLIIPWVAAILGIVLVGAATWYLRMPEPHQVTRFYHELGRYQIFPTLNYSSIAVSPDGRKFVYDTNEGLFIRSLEDFSGKPIVDASEHPSTPFFSPDGQWIGYWSIADYKLKKMALSGGAPVDLCEAGNVGGASWSMDDTIVYGAMEAGIMRISASGGTPEKIIEAQGETFFHPRILPDGKSLIFTLGTDEGYRVTVQSLESGERKELFPGDCAWYLPTGHIVYALDSNLYAIPYDIGRLVATGGAITVVQGVYRLLKSITAPQFALSDSGTLIYLLESESGSVLGQSTLVRIDGKGKEESLDFPPQAYHHPKISPDGRRVALTVSTGEDTDIWILDLASKNRRRLTFERSADMFPLWTPDGERIVFTSAREGSFGVNWQAADGTGGIESLLNPRSNRASLTIPSAWSRDGRTLLLEDDTGATGNIGMMSMEGERNLQPLLHEKYAEIQPQISPDGRWMAYTSDEFGQNQIFVRPYPEVNGGKWQVSTGGGTNPLWSPTGRELFYHDGATVMAVSIKTDPTFNSGTPIPLFHGPPFSFNIIDATARASWDISPDGTWFLMIKPDDSRDSESTTEGPRKINIVLNWFEELKEKVPID